MKSATKPKISDEMIKELVKKDFGDSSEVLYIEELSAGFFNTAYAVTLEDKFKTLLKVAPSTGVKTLRYEKNIMKAEVSVLKLITAQTDIPVPKVYSYNSKKDTIDNEYFFMQYIYEMPLDKLYPKLSREQFEIVSMQLGEYAKKLIAFLGKSSDIPFQAIKAMKSGLKPLFHSLMTLYRMQRMLMSSFP